MRLTQRLLERNMDIFKHIAPFCSKPSAWLFASFCIEIEKKKKSSSVHRQSHEHRQNEPPTTPPTRTTIYMTNGHPDRAWNRHVCFDIFCFVVVGKKCNPNPNRKLTEMSRTGNLLLLISSLILRSFSKTFSFIVYFYILETHRL